MVIHTLGNGPSIRLFDRDAWPETDVFVGCNFSDIDLRPDYTMIVDVGAMKMFRGGKDAYQLDIPAVLTQRAYDYIDKDTKGWHTMTPGKINVIDVIPLERDRSIARRLAMNSGQHAVLYAIRQNPEIDTVHLWGIDSFWSDDLESKSDAIVRPKQTTRRIKPSVVSQWNGYWKKVFSDHPNHTFVVHGPSDANVRRDVSDRSNVRVELGEA